jgi:uncharacterized metal-binding protein YceD (DUF177 family)
VTKPRTEPPAPHGFRRLVTVAKVSESGFAQTIEAKPEEHEKIAEYLDLVAVGSLKADILLSRWRGKGLRVTGKLVADVTQSCVVTLDPVEAKVEAEFERRFLPDVDLEHEQGKEHEVFVDPEGEDPPEPLGREIDLGELLIEELSLNLDPYPRKPGVEFEDAAAAAPRENPFAKLAKLKPKLVDKNG